MIDPSPSVGAGSEKDKWTGHVYIYAVQRTCTIHQKQDRGCDSRHKDVNVTRVLARWTAHRMPGLATLVVSLDSLPQIKPMWDNSPKARHSNDTYV